MRGQCSIPNCGTTAVTKGLCNAHYLRSRRGADMLAPVQRATSPQSRFWAKVDKSESCWEWLANKTHDGYGSFSYQGGMVRAHRLSFEWSSGPIPEGMQVDHTCWNPPCVNPAHLRLATNKANSQNRAGAHRDSTSDIRGVSWYAKSGKWRAYGHVDAKQYHLGYFDSIADAEQAAIAWRIKNHPHSLMDQRKAS